MDSGDVVSLICLLVLLFFSGAFSATETALMTVNKLRIRILAEEEKNKKAVTLMKVLEHQDKMLSAVLIGNNLVNISASALATLLATKFFGNAGAGVATGVLTILILIFGEISPKNLASIYSEKLALFVAPVILFLMWILTPVIFLINILARAFIRLLGVDPDRKDIAYTENEIRSIVDTSHQEGVIEKSEKFMINNVFDFGDSEASDIMIPRIDVAFLSVDAGFEELQELFRENKYTRYPVYEGSSDNVIGIINIKDVFLYNRNRQFHVRDYMREPFFTYRTKKTSELMMEMRESNINICIVLDEYGITAGIITLEDLLEEIVGEIRDEFDEDEKDAIVAVAPGEYLVEAGRNLDDINDALETDFASENYDSLGGLVMECLDHIPEQGEETVYGDIRLVAERVKHHRIVTVRVILPEKEKEEDPDRF